MKKRKNVIYRKSVSLLAAAAMTAVLMTGQIYPVAAQTQIMENLIETSSLIPDNVTIDEPVALSQVALPKSEYGTLQWLDDTYVPEKRVQSCEVVFKPAKSVDLSYLSGWDEKEKVVKGEVTVVVTSIEAEEPDEVSEDEKKETASDPAGDVKDTEAATEGDNTDNSENSADSEDGSEAPAGEDEASTVTDNEKTDSSEVTGDPAADKSETEEKTEESDSSSATEPDEEPALSEVGEEVSGTGADSTENTDTAPATSSENKLEETASEVTDSATSSGETSSNEAGNTDETEASADVVQPGVLNEVFGGAMPGATVLDGDENSQDTAASTEKEESTTEDVVKNIFDNPLDFTTLEARPDTVEDNLTEEEQAARAAENHSCEGISVSGIDLPWYVQFQVSSGESYEFKNEEKANIFQAYEFKLWDLKNNTEYEIPDGQYISVTIPVKEGYEYSIEHLLDNGATETIVPSVNGSTMVFSTHSFSPFGIAGFYPIIGEEIADNAYGDNVTPTPTPTPAVSGTPTPSPSITGTAGNGSTSGSGNSTIGGTAGNGSGTTSGSSGTTGTTGNGSGTTTGTVTDGTGSNGNGTDGTGNSGTTGAGNGTGTTTGNGSAAGTTTTGASSGNSQSSSTGTNASGTQSSNAVKTGDNTVILPFIILIAAAVIVVVIIVVVMLHKKKDKED